jgi:hypothetical protein
MEQNEDESLLLSTLKTKYTEGATTETLLTDFPGWLASHVVQHMNSLSGKGLVDFIYSGDSGQLVFKAKAANELAMYHLL